MKKRWPIILALLIMEGISGCATFNSQAEFATWPPPKDEKKPKFVKSFMIGSRQAYLTRFVWEGESIDNWTESLEIFNTWKKNFPPTPEDAYKSLVEKRKTKCPEDSVHIIRQDNNSILYEITTVNCPPQADENSINRILYGNTNVFSFTYTNKVKNLPKETRDEWIRILSEAAIKTNEPKDLSPISRTH